MVLPACAVLVPLTGLRDGLTWAHCAQYKTQLRKLREKVEEDIEVVKRREVRDRQLQDR